MYLKINDLVRYMQFENSIFNPFEYELYFKNEILVDEKAKEILSRFAFMADELFRKNNSFTKEETENWLPVPYVTEMEAVEDFISTMDKKQKYSIEKKLGESFDINSFYNVLLNMDMEEKWNKFYFEYRKKIAIEWCNENGIVYTEKDSLN